jgi:hypothetical protein
MKVKQELIDLVEDVLQTEEGHVHLLGYPWAKQQVPKTEDKHQGGTISDWVATVDDAGDVLFIRGRITDDNRFLTGEALRTSYVVNMDYDEATQTGTLETRNTLYLLGKKMEL